MKSFNRTSLYIIILLIFLFASCTPDYMPNALNVPMHKHKNEVQTSMNVSLSGFEPQLSYALSKHVGIMINGSYQRLQQENNTPYHRHHFTEIALGYHNFFQDLYSFELYGGGGYGRNIGEFSSELYRQNVYNEMYRYFLQPSVGLTTDYLDLYFASRIAYLQLIKKEYSIDQYFIDPVVGFRVGYKHIKLETQAGFSFPTKESKIIYQPFIFSAGVTFSLFRPDEETKQLLDQFF
jgi:hypothetical protein